MLTKKQYALLFLVALIPFLFYFIDPDFYGADPYHFLNHICEKGSLTIDQPIGASVIFSLLPCNFFVLKIVLFLLCFISAVIIAHTGKLLHEKNGWMAGLFVFLSPFWIKEFFKLEDDQFAYPLLFLSMYFFIKGRAEKKWWPQILAVGIATFCGAIIWKGAALYVFAYAMSFFPALLLSIVMMLLMSKEIIGGILPNSKVLENLSLIGLGFLSLLFFGFAFYEPIIFMQLLFFTGIMLLNMRYTLHVIPLLAIIIAKNFDRPIGLFKKLLKQDVSLKNNKLVVYMAIALSIFIVIFQMPNQMPNEPQKEAINVALSYSDTVINDWDLGYWIIWQGGKPSRWGGGVYEQDFNNSIAITRQKLDCNILYETREGYGGRLLYVYDCNTI